MDITTTLFLSQLIGIFFLVASISMFLTPNMLRGIFKEMGKSRAISYMVGLLTIIISLAIILLHKDFVTEPGKLITLLGYAVFVEGLFFIIMPTQLIKRYTGTLKNNKFYYGIAFGYLTIGLYLSYVGYIVAV